ncbi:dicarboxylate/amino acid:cation symporter [Lishizhenia sp.]|uniref:dicarboxylate/amino acid:cation symporter n=1 Tax=Lishizhenia sp. TaxID=2497594 RepID=UPI00299D4BDD|nr:dicarboxylate/amino acid:cation symporter [Lishizhenia sp.]MDX1447054.1 dicarboxylate/amino acid:cation symporter [Lishizhenia sp.]
MKEKKKMALHWRIMIAMALGVIWAIVSNYLGWNDFTTDWIGPFGTIFINSLKFIAIPLILFGIIGGVASLENIGTLGKMGGKTLLTYLITTVISVSLGLILVNIFNPGKTDDEAMARQNRLEYEMWATDNNVEIKDNKNLLATATPEEISKIKSVMVSDTTSADYKDVVAKKSAAEQKMGGPLQPLVDMVPTNLFKAFAQGEMLQVIFFAIFFGIVLAFLPNEKVGVVINFVNGMNEAFVKMVDFIMIASPYFIFCLMAGVLAKMADTPEEMFEIFYSLGKYALVVLAGLLLLIFGFYPLLLRLFGAKVGYREFFNAMSPAQFLAFSTASSAATLPVTIECVEDTLKVPQRVTRFVLPIGATVNMDGTSLYQSVAVIYLAQLFGVDLDFQQQLGIVATATLASIGSAAVPSAGLIMLMIVLESVGLNSFWVVLIYPIDPLLDRFRTVANVTSDATVSTIIAKTDKEK